MGVIQETKYRLDNKMKQQLTGGYMPVVQNKKPTNNLPKLPNKMALPLQIWVLSRASSVKKGIKWQIMRSLLPAWFDHVCHLNQDINLYYKLF